MVKSTIEKIINDKGYKISREDIESILIDMGYTLNNNGYTIYDSQFNINAIKLFENGRFHFIVSLHQDGKVHNSSEVSLHIDKKSGLFHGIEVNGNIINKEYNLFYKKLIKRAKRNK